MRRAECQLCGMGRLVKLRRAVAIVILGIAVIAAGFYLATHAKRSVKEEPSGHSGTGSPAFADGSREKNPHEQEMLRTALKKRPGHLPVLLRLAKIESESGHAQEAAADLRRILDMEPENPEANLELGKVLFQLGDIHGAIRHTEGILKTQPAYEDALYNLGAIYANIGDGNRARDYWTRLTAQHSNSESAQKARQMMSLLVTTR